MFQLYANKNQLVVRKREPVTSGSVNVCCARFEFSEDWEGLERVAVFRSGDAAVSVLLDGGGECQVPWEVLTVPGRRLEAGIYGTRGGEIVLPTIWANLGLILEGVKAAEAGGNPPAPELWEQALSGKGDGLGYTEGGELGLYAGDKLLSSVPMSGGGEVGTEDHRTLTHREDERQHPIRAIDGLEEELRRIPEPVEPLTNEELEEIFK